MGRDALAQWLGRLHGLLGALSPQGLALVDGLPLAAETEWTDRLDAATRVLAATPDFDPIHARGWLVRLHVREGPPIALLLALEQRIDESDPLLVIAFALCRLAWRLSERLPHPAGPARAETREAIHALRNGLNSVVMTSAVITGPQLSPDLRVFANDLENAVDRSVKALKQLAALTSPD